MISRTKLFQCTYCETTQQRQYLECVSQIPKDFCTQQFIVTTQNGFNGDLLKPTDLICTSHEEHFRLKYISYVRGGTYTKEYRQKYKERNAVLNPSPCSCCNKICTILHRVSNFKNEDFIRFVLEQGIQRMTRSASTGIFEADEICPNCYKILRRKWADPHYTPKKKHKQQLKGGKRKLKSKRLLPSKRLCTEQADPSTSQSHLQLQDAQPTLLLSPTHQVAPALTPPRFRTPTPTGSMVASTQYMRQMEIDIPELARPAFPSMKSPIRQLSQSMLISGTQRRT